MSIEVEKLAKSFLESELPEGGECCKISFLAGYHTAYNIAYECGFEEGLKAQKTLTDIQAILKKTNENT